MARYLLEQAGQNAEHIVEEYQINPWLRMNLRTLRSR